ncbi:hypothetical protein [Streptomyces sp. SA15]|nr:hypothetical protein [Streptomyces sp. SA15]
MRDIVLTHFDADHTGARVRPCCSPPTGRWGRSHAG